MRKNKVIALVLAVLFPGLGHIYLGLVERGIIILLLFPVALLADIFILEPILKTLSVSGLLYEALSILLSPLVWFYIWEIKEVYVKVTSIPDFEKRRVKIK